MPVSSLYAANDPNPDPPPLVEEIREFQAHCCMRMTLWHAQLQRRMQGPPELKKTVNQEKAAEYEVTATASFESQGFRPYMEDRVVNSTIGDGRAGLFAVLDGHGLEGEGHLVAECAAASLARVVNKHMTGPSASTPTSVSSSGMTTNGSSSRTVTAANSGVQVVDSASSASGGAGVAPNATNSTSSAKSNGSAGCPGLLGDRASSCKALVDKETIYKERLDRAISEIDMHIRRVLPSYADDNGSTLSAALVEPELITFANVGDSRGVLVNADYSLEFVTLDHKPTVPAEEIRVQLAGGFISDMRVNGDLAVSRTIGDVSYKPVTAPRRHCAISNEPDVTCIRREPKHRCIILASDGIWDALSSADVVAHLKRFQILEGVQNAGKDAKSFPERVDLCFAAIVKEASCSRLSSDNLSMMIILLGDKVVGPAATASAAPAASSPSSASSSSSSSVAKQDTTPAKAAEEGSATKDEAETTEAKEAGDVKDERNLEIELT
ncbi:Protein phosphatase, putative [Hondaea fermentalgiana]|uniref:Protein phosphatase, putative n=1 Tax=Hondaea fermentalgiana TaxID=2315210 RepID=A0A2R5GVL9_9STRA|nr:Protein phosphatase, putative [Hondaea fermentalgiana]|eukprot:GBG32703.1 Protein phosphatase, putative [Hondaea fermentalgiana]